MLLINWGRNVKRIANGALMKCEHCKNVTVYEICETYAYLGAYLIRLGRGKKKYIMACPVCHHGYALDPTKIDQVLRDTINVPSFEEVQPIWAAMEVEANKDSKTMLESMLRENDEEKLFKTLADWREDIAARVTSQGHPPERVKYVAEFWANDLLQSMVDVVRRQPGKGA